jgi:hypothetical protein
LFCPAGSSRSPDAAQRAASASFPDVQLHIVDAPPTSGLPEFGNIVVQVGNSRLGCAGPESILPIVVMDSGLAPSGAPRNDGLISVRDASGICSRGRVVICPSGGFLTGLSSLISDFPKNISVPTHPKSHLELCASHPTRGALAIVTNAGWDAVDAAAFCARWDRRAGRKTCERFPCTLTSDDCCGRQNRVVLTPRRWRQVRGVLLARPGSDKTLLCG